MAKKKSSDFGGLLLLVLGGVAWLFVQYGKEILIVGGIAIAAWVVYKLFGPNTQSPPAPQPAPAATPAGAIAISFRGPGFIPGRPTSSNGDDFWQTPTFGGKNLGGWIYTGNGLAAASGDGIEPALVDPKLPVDRSVQDCHARRLDYWPSYGGASPQARAAYLHWLGTGRQDPLADIGYVFLYFYGLERRVLHDAQVSEAAKAELPAIREELKRLLAIYKGSNSFQNYAGSLLDILKSKFVEPRLYDRSPPALRRERELTFDHRLALAQCAADGKPLPAEWAYVWFRADPTTYLRTPGVRCADEFRRLFVLRYRETFGDGLALPRNRTLLKIERRPASPTFGFGFSGHTLKFDLPDVTVLTSPVKKLQELAESCYSRLDSYSRFIKNHQELANTFDALVELPLALWPEAVRKPVEYARALVERAGKPLAIPFEKLRSWFPEWQLINKQKLQSLYRVLGEAGLGMEPDLRFAGGIPTSDSTVVLFADDALSTAPAPSARYSAAALTLQLGAAVAVADGESSDVEKDMLTRQLEERLHLNESERRRLRARLRLLLVVPPKLTGLKSRVDTLDAAQREAIGEFLALVALADGIVTPAEINSLEKTFRLLGLDPKSVYSKVHVAATEPITVQPATTAATGHPIPQPHAAEKISGIQLDPAKVAALQADSERVSAILGSIFAQAAPEPEPVTAMADADAEQPQEPALMGLDVEHSALVRTLLTRVHWARVELEELATDRGLMLDGALEQLNDAAFEKYDKPLLEGEDPVDINQEVAREMLQ